MLTRTAEGVEPDVPKIQKGAEGRSPAEEVRLGAAYLSGRGVPRDVKQAAYWYEKAADSGDPGAQLEIGFLYEAGIGVDRNPTRAAQWFERAAANGLTGAKVNLGVAYARGIGVRKDPEFGAELFRQAAKKGNGVAACYLGDMYSLGIGIPQSASEARSWYEVGAKLHSPIAEYDLAAVLSADPKHADQSRILKLLRNAARAGYVPAKHQLGALLVLDPKLARSSTEAIDLLQEANAAGYWQSSMLMGVLAREGKNRVALDKGRAYFYFRLAVLQGGSAAATRLDSELRALRSELSELEVRSIDAEAAAWMGTHNDSPLFAGLHGDDTDFPASALEYPEKGVHAGVLIVAPISQDVHSKDKTSR